MAGCKPLSPDDENHALRAMKKFSLRDQALVLVGLNTGFRIIELLSLEVGQVWENGAVRPRVTITRRKLKGGRGRRRKSIVSRSVPLNGAVADVLEQVETALLNERRR